MMKKKKKKNVIPNYGKHDTELQAAQKDRQWQKYLKTAKTLIK